MPRKSAATEKLEETAAQRSKCFGACNVHAKDVCGVCQSLTDCLLVTPSLNKGYDPEQPEEEGKNEATYVYPVNDKKKRVEVEKIVVKLKAKAEAPAKPAREAQPAPKPVREPAKQEPPKEAKPPVEETPAGEVDDILSEIDNLASDGPEAAEPAEQESLDLDLGEETPVEEPAVEIEPPVESEPEPDPVETVTAAAEKVEAEKEPPVQLTGDLEMAKYLIDHFVNRLGGMLMDVMHPDKSSKSKVMAEPTEEPVVRKGKPGPKPGAKKKTVKKTAGRRKPGPKPGKGRKKK